MTSQQEADTLLAEWQAHRALSPEQRLQAAVEKWETLIGAMFMPPPSIMSEVELDFILDRVSTEMAA